VQAELFAEVLGALAEADQRLWGGVEDDLWLGAGGAEGGGVAGLDAADARVFGQDRGKGLAAVADLLRVLGGLTAEVEGEGGPWLGFGRRCRGHSMISDTKISVSKNGRFGGPDDARF
jgi:hypothetical protein